MLLVDERRLPAGDAVAPAAFLAQLVEQRVLGDGERRAVVRRIAATREDVSLPAHVRSSPSFAERVLDAIDHDRVPAAFETLAQHVRTLLAFGGALDVRGALRLALGTQPEIGGGTLRLDAALVGDDDDAFAW
ncbi:MAG TPA: hypothetical protein VHT05_06195, partial [Candidatus Elarobacter sp.]|nr:hypothetical protein [Candidatus Elarobacter sp.]